MFTQLTDDLLDLVVTAKGQASGLLAMNEPDSSCSSSASSSLCCSFHLCW
jgi:hypothetical protein